MNGRWMVLAVALVAGCGGSSDPANVRLAAGQELMVVGDGAKSVLMHAWEDNPASNIEFLKPGTRVQCESDKDPVSPVKKSVNGIKNPDYRGVQVLVLDGEFKGKVGLIDRFNLRPVAK